MSKMHGTLKRDEVLHREGRKIVKKKVAFWIIRDGWKGHPVKELARRRAANKVARASRKRNR